MLCALCLLRARSDRRGYDAPRQMRPEHGLDLALVVGGLAADSTALPGHAAIALVHHHEDADCHHQAHAEKKARKRFNLWLLCAAQHYLHAFYVYNIMSRPHHYTTSNEEASRWNCINFAHKCILFVWQYINLVQKTTMLHKITSMLHKKRTNTYFAQKCIKMDHFCTQNHQLCTKRHHFRTKMYPFCNKIHHFRTRMHQICT